MASLVSLLVLSTIFTCNGFSHNILTGRAGSISKRQVALCEGNGFVRSQVKQFETRQFATVSKAVTSGTSSKTALFQSTVINGSVETSSMALDAVVCGGGPAGLLSAIMLAKSFDYKVKVYERLPPPPSPTDESVWSDVSKFYLIGLGERAQSALNEFGVWEDVKACCVAVPGRMDWAPDAGPDEGVERIFTDRPIMTQVLPRDKLVGVLHQHILKNYANNIELEYQKEVMPLDFFHDDGTSVLMGVEDCDTSYLRDVPFSVNMTGLQTDKLCDTQSFQTISARLLIAADGAARTISNEMEKVDKERRDSMSFLEKIKYGPSFRIRRYVDDNQRVYKTVPMKVPTKWRGDLNYSARSKDGRILFDSLPADSEGNHCAVLLLKKDDELAKENSDPAMLRQLFDDFLPQFSVLLDDETIKDVARKPPSYLPSFRYATPRLNLGNSSVILGDSAHTVKPYFGLGANSALQDAQFLKHSIETTTSIKDAVHLYSKERAGEAEALVKISRELDRPGVLGLFTFVFPLILDSIFHRMAPKLFATNTIAMLQKSSLSFRGIQRRKLLDRLGQMTLLGSLFAGIGVGLGRLTTLFSRITGKNNGTVVATVVGGLAAIAILKKIAVFFLPGLAPADVLTKTKDGVTAGSRKASKPVAQRAVRYDEAKEDPTANMSGGGI